MLEFQKGDQASFETLLRKYYPKIFSFIYRFVGSRETAEDLTQETLIRVFHSRKTYRPQAKFQTWVYTIAKNISLNELRRSRRKHVSLTGGDGESAVLLRQLEDPAFPRPDRALMQEELQSLIRTAINSLPENQQLAVVLRRYEEFSYEEIARVLKCSVSAVKSLLNRAKEQLKIKLAGILNEKMLDPV